MEAEVCGLNSASIDDKEAKVAVRLKKKSIRKVLEQCERALESLGNIYGVDDDDDDDDDDGDDKNDGDDDVSQGPELTRQGSAAVRDEREVDELYDLLRSRVGCSDFLEKLGCAQLPGSLNTAGEESSSWFMVSEKDLWEREDTDAREDDYVRVVQEDIVDGIACFMAAYLASLKETKDLTPNQLQKALSKTLSVKKRNGKLRKVWDGSKAIYNVVSWGATAVGIYQNPVLIGVASKAFWTSFHVISKLL